MRRKSKNIDLHPFPEVRNRERLSVTVYHANQILTFLHRNTVIYRLNKAKELLGNDFNHMPYKYELYFALALSRVMD